MPALHLCSQHRARSPTELSRWCRAFALARDKVLRYWFLSRADFELRIGTDTVYGVVKPCLGMVLDFLHLRNFSIPHRAFDHQSHYLVRLSLAFTGRTTHEWDEAKSIY